MPQDFSGQNLRGRSFKDQNLTGANFSNADIRSTNFTGANLTSANFTGAKAGLQKRWAILLVVVSWVLASLLGFLSAFAGYLIAFLILNTKKDYQLASQIAGWTTTITVNECS